MLSSIGFIEKGKTVIHLVEIILLIYDKIKAKWIITERKDMHGFWLAYERRAILVPEYQHKVHKKLYES